MYLRTIDTQFRVLIARVRYCGDPTTDWVVTVVGVVVVAGWPSFGRLSDTRLNGSSGEFN